MSLEIRCSGCDCSEGVRAMPAAVLLRILSHWIEHHKHGEVAIVEVEIAAGLHGNEWTFPL